MGKTGIPWVLWDSHGNGSKIIHGMGMGMKSLKWEGIGTKNLFPHTSSPEAVRATNSGCSQITSHPLV